MQIYQAGGSGVSYPSSKYFRDNMEIYKLFPPIIKSICNDNINLIVTGSSGLLFGSYLMTQLNNTSLFHIRKNVSNSHGSEFEYCYDFKAETHLIVDDFIQSGETLKFIKEKITYSFSDIKIDGICVTGDHTSEREINIIKTILPNIKYLICG